MVLRRGRLAREQHRIVRPRAGDGYAIAILAGERVTWREGIDTIEGIAAPMNAALRAVR